MKCKVESLNEGNPREYPYLGISERAWVVKFLSKDNGVCIINGNGAVSHETGVSGWAERNFTPLQPGDKIVITEG